MKKYQATKLKQVLTTASALILMSLQSMSAAADSRDKTHGETVIEGSVVTGTNDVLGQPLFSWGQPYGAFHFPSLGAYNPNGPKPLPINQDTPADAILATMVDPNFLIVARANPDDVKPEWLNVPLRNVPVNTDFFFVIKNPLPSVLGADGPFRQAQAEPVAGAITLGQWMHASGTARINCHGEGASVELRMKNLIPHRMYTVWGTLGLPRDGSAQTFFPIPLGGTPNMIISDEAGDAVFKRVIKFCPFDTEATNRPLLTINVQYHANHQNYGGVPEPGFLPGWWQGLVTFNHVVFPVNVEVLPR